MFTCSWNLAGLRTNSNHVGGKSLALANLNLNSSTACASILCLYAGVAVGVPTRADDKMAITMKFVGFAWYVLLLSICTRINYIRRVLVIGAGVTSFVLGKRRIDRLRMEKLKQESRNHHRTKQNTPLHSN